MNDNSPGTNDYSRGFEAGKSWSATFDEGMIGFRSIKGLTFNEALRNSIKVRVLFAYAAITTGLLLGLASRGIW